MKNRIAILMCLVGLFVLAPAAAMAASPQSDTYGAVEGVAGVSAAPTSPSGPSAVVQSSNSSSSLPFTGSDTLLFGGVGVLLLGTGLMMRRANRSDL